MTTQSMTAGEDQSLPLRLWDIKDVSAFLGVPVATIYQWRVRSGGPPAMRRGRHLRYDPGAVSTWAHQKQDHPDGRCRS